MAQKVWKVGTSNAFSTTLDGSITDSDTTINLTTTSGLQAPGVIVIDRQDANEVDTPTIREYISFTGISSNSLTGCTRGLGGSSAQAHSSGALVEETWSVTHWNDFVTAFEASHTDTGQIVTASTATMPTARVFTHLNASGASISGEFPIRPVWVVGGAVSLTTTSVGKPLPVDRDGFWQFFSMTLRTPVSGSSLVVDINKNNTSIFDAGTRPIIAGGGTYVSTASIATPSFTAGDIFTVDIDNGGGDADDLTITGKGE